MKKSKIILIAVAFLFLICVVWMLWGNLTVGMTAYHIFEENLPDGMDGYRIVQISDLHNYEFGDANSDLIDILKSESPDVIFITGDIVDSKKTDMDISVDFASKAVEIAPCYFVTGNHEYRLLDGLDILLQRLKDVGVTVLRNESLTLTVNGDKLQLIGVDDPNFTQHATGGRYNSREVMTMQLDGIQYNGDYTILLSHRPELFDIYVEHGIDIAFCGHAHGGQVRLPFIGGLYAPHQGSFPQYDSGVYSKENTEMIVSRGIGNSIFPIRFNNRAEIVTVTLNKK